MIFRIGVVRLEKGLDVLDCVIISINDLFVRLRCDEEVIGSSVLDILLGALHLEVHWLWILWLL